MTKIPNRRQKLHRVMERMDGMHRVQRHIQGLRNVLGQAQLIEAFGHVAQEHFLSRPVVATMRATPGFTAAAANFPEAAIFNIVPEHQSSARQVMALETLTAAQDDTSTTMVDAVKQVVGSFESVFATLEDTAVDLIGQLQQDKARLESAEVHPDVVVDLPVYTLSEERFGKLFGMMESYLKDVSVFDTSELKANPQKIREEIDSLADLADDMGEALGITITSDGLVEADRHADYEPSEGTFGEKGITKEMLVFFMDRAIDLCETLKALGARKEQFVGALYDNGTDLPMALNSDDVTYGTSEHVTLFNCYVTLTTKCVREAIVLVSRLLTAADSILDLTEEDELETVAE